MSAEKLGDVSVETHAPIILAQSLLCLPYPVVGHGEIFEKVVEFCLIGIWK